jgi:hypothetical protein
MPPYSASNRARDKQEADDVIRAPVREMTALVRAFAQAAAARAPIVPTLRSPSGNVLVSAAVTRERRAALGMAPPTEARLLALLATYRSPTSTDEQKSRALDDLRVFAATTALGHSARFFGGSLHIGTDSFSVSLSPKTPLGVLYRALFDRDHVLIARVSSEVNAPRLMGGTLVLMLDKHAPAFAAQLDLGLGNGLVCGAAVRALRTFGRVRHGHLEALLEIDLPCPAPPNSFAHQMLAGHGKGRATPRGQPGALARAASLQMERPLRPNGLPEPQ